MLQQERLTHSLDLVEVNLLHAVSTRSEDFYEALDSWQGLTELVRAGVEQIERLRATVAAIDQRLARTALRLPFLCRQRSNQLRLHRQLALLAAIRTAQPTIQALLATEDYVGALELIGSTQRTLRGDLAGVRCFVHLDEELALTTKSLTLMMAQASRRPPQRPRIARAALGGAGERQRGTAACLGRAMRRSRVCACLGPPRPHPTSAAGLHAHNVGRARGQQRRQRGGQGGGRGGGRLRPRGDAAADRPAAARHAPAGRARRRPRRLLRLDPRRD
jgi:hypothetical protein